MIDPKNINNMKNVFEMQLNYLKQELESLEKIKRELMLCTGKAYKLLGNIFVECDKETLMKEVDQSIEEIKRKIELIERQLERMKKNEEEEKEKEE